MRIQEGEAASEQGRELVREVWEVVHLKYVDARGGGFDQEKWARLRDEALSQPLRDQAATYRLECCFFCFILSSFMYHMFPKAPSSTFHLSSPLSVLFCFLLLFSFDCSFILGMGLYRSGQEDFFHSGMLITRGGGGGYNNL